MNINKCSMESYIAGLLDGDGTICIGKCNNDYQLKVELSQCNRDIFEAVKSYFPKKYEDARDYKYTKENCVGYRVCGKRTDIVIELMLKYSIIKFPQAQLAKLYWDNIHVKGKKEERKECYERMHMLNLNKTYPKPFERMCDEYIAGLFDAEGCVSFRFDKTGKLKWYVQLVQVSAPDVIDNLIIYFKFGSQTSGKGRWRFYSKANFIIFYNKIRPFSIVKAGDLDNLKTALSC